MEKNVAVICGTVGLLGLVAVILGFVGEGTKSQSLVGYDGVNCVYRTTPALGCGVVGALFLLTAQVVVSSATGCFGCCRTRRNPSKTKHVIAVVMSVVSRVLLIIAVGLFFVGARWNAAVERRPAKVSGSSTSQQGECYVLPGGVFATASVLSLVIVAFGITSYFLLDLSAPPEETAQQQRQPGIAMGQPAYFQPEQRGYPVGAAWPYDGKAATTML